jgi:hypothetical protein
MKTATLCALMLAACLSASADFSYTSTMKTTGGSMAAMMGAAGDRTTTVSWKGQKMVTVSGTTSTIIDVDSQTVTTINNTQKTWTVKTFSDLVGTAGANTDVSVDVKETAQKKTVNGFNASEVLVTMNMDMEMGRGGMSMKLQLELDMWISSEVPGAADLHAFYRKNAASFPWSAMMADSGNQSVQKAIAQVQRKLADLDGIPVQQILRVKPAGGAQTAQAPQMPQMTPAQAAQMQAAMAKMQDMAKQGGPGAAAAQQMMAGMGAMNGAPAGGAAPALIELTVDYSSFSSASVPDSLFSIPDGYKQIK